MDQPQRHVLEAASCWFDTDRAPGDPRTTAWKRTARLRQAAWREAHGYPMGAHPYGGGDTAVPVGSRLAFRFAVAQGANFVTADAKAAVVARLGARERLEMLRRDRLWADLLSSMPLCFNVFGTVWNRPEALAAAVREWWPDAPVGSIEMRFEHSPGRSDRAFLGNKSAFDVAFDIDCAGPIGGRAFIGVEVKYHEHARPEPTPLPAALERYAEVTERSGVFRDDWRARILGTKLQQLWLDHLLVLSMLQHPSAGWRWGRFVLVYPAENPSFTAAAAAYRDVLTDTATFEARTVEDLLATPGALEPSVVEALRGRYCSAGGSQ